MRRLQINQCNKCGLVTSASREDHKKVCGNHLQHTKALPDLHKYVGIDKKLNDQFNEIELELLDWCYFNLCNIFWDIPCYKRDEEAATEHNKYVKMKMKEVHLAIKQLRKIYVGEPQKSFS